MHNPGEILVGLAPADWEVNLDDDQALDLAARLAKLLASARQVLLAALDASVARLGRERIAALIDRRPST